MPEISNIGVFAALAGGAISFLSPCVLPLVPGYVSYIAGGTAAGAWSGKSSVSRMRKLGLSGCFVLGFSTVFVLRSVPDAGKALAETRRVLKHGGQMLFVEHGLAHEQKVRRWQHRLDPFWWRVSCHLHRPIDRLIEGAGFKIDKLDTGYLGAGPKAMTFLYEGVAVNRR